MTLAGAHAPDPSPCPGPIPTSQAHAERCRACGKCDAIIVALMQDRNSVARDFNKPARRLEPAMR
jgi:hypothetical protein